MILLYILLGAIAFGLFMALIVLLAGAVLALIDE